MEGLFSSTFFQKKNMSSWLFKDKINYSNPCSEILHSLAETETNAESWFAPTPQSRLACSNRFFGWIFCTTWMRHHPGFRHDLLNTATACRKKTNQIIKRYDFLNLFILGHIYFELRSDTIRDLKQLFILNSMLGDLCNLWPQQLFEKSFKYLIL